jgi:hypothetical protein
MCASLVREEDKGCSVCGYLFTGTDEEKPAVGKGKIKCPHCRAAIELNSVYCKICGKAVDRVGSIHRK